MTEGEVIAEQARLMRRAVAYIRANKSSGLLMLDLADQMEVLLAVQAEEACTRPL